MSVKNSKIVVTEKYPDRTYQLQTSDLQKGNIDLSKLSTKSRYILCVFDTKKKDGSSGADGFLSRQEINDALNYFSKFADKYDYDNEFSHYEQTDALIALTPKIAQKSGTKYILNDYGEATFVKTQGNKLKDVVKIDWSHIRESIKELIGLVSDKKLEEARQVQYRELNLKPTKENKNLYRTADGSLYRMDVKNNKYVKLSNVESISSEGYTKKGKFGEHGWNVITKYTSDGKEQTIQLSNSKGEVEKNKEKVAKAFGLLPEYGCFNGKEPGMFGRYYTSSGDVTGRYIDAGTGGVYVWDNKTSSFINIGFTIDYEWIDNIIVNKNIDQNYLMGSCNLARSDKQANYQQHLYEEDK